MLRARRLLAALAVFGAALALAAGAIATPRAQTAAASRLIDWPEFGLDPQRSDATDLPTGITAANVGRLVARTVTLPGTVDDSAIYRHAAIVDGAPHDTIFVTTSYGITLAIDADSGRILWRFDPPGLASWQGGSQITMATPILVGRYIYATSPNGVVHKLAVDDGREAPGWPVHVTPLPSREKLTASLNVAGGELLATTGGYDGDTPPYVGHIVAISLASGHIDAVFNTLCANRTTIIDPPTCRASDSAILSRSGPVVEPGATRVLIATGNAPYNGTTDFGDSLIELTLPGLRLHQVYTPTNQANDNTGDVDFGSGSPALLPGDLVLDGGKDATLRLLNLNALDGHPPGTPPRLGGDLQDLPTPANAELWSAPAVWHDDVFVATGSEGGGATAAYRLAGGRLHQIWSNSNHGSSPIVAGGLLYIYDVDNGGVNVYDPATGHALAKLPAPAGHWNSPIVVDGHVIVPTGNADDHQTTGQLVIFSLPRS
jgi:hypothetical protein